MSTRWYRVALAFTITACGGEGIESVTSNGDWQEISYRGQRRLAQRQGDSLVIEGDIVVGRADRWGDAQEPPQGGRGIDVRQNALTRKVGAQFKWPNGNVTYSVTNVALNDRAAVRAGIDLWRYVPGLNITEAPSACTGDCIDIISTTVNNSFVGRQGGAQVLNVQASPPPGVVAHEFGHALGAWHEQSRADRNSFVQINWAQVIGCTNSATSITNCGANACESGTKLTPRENAVSNGCCTDAQYGSNECYRAHNFDQETPSSGMYAYDYGSIMHYGPLFFAKGTTATLTATQPVAPGVMGQRISPSERDLLAMSALYPLLQTTSVLFRDTGAQKMTRLAGREEDVNTSYLCLNNGLLFGLGAVVDTGALAETTYPIVCIANSPLWAVDYAYPSGTTVSWPSSGAESFATSTSLVVLNAGLIPSLSTPL